MQSQVYSKPVIEFITVSREYCIMIEGINKEIRREDLLLRLSLLLPLLYLKSIMLPTLCEICEDPVNEFVTEPIYYDRMHAILSLLKEQDDYLVFKVENEKYEETPQVASIAEDLADLYQNMKNVLVIYEQGIDDVMNDALSLCKIEFQENWGETLLNVLRAIHGVRFAFKDETGI